MSKQSKRLSKRGSNAIEFALTAPILLFAIFGLFEFGWFFCNNIIANEMAISLSRKIAMRDPADMEEAFEKEALIFAEDWRYRGMTGEPAFSYRLDDSRVIVSIKVNYNGITPVSIFGKTVELTASSFVPNGEE